MDHSNKIANELNLNSAEATSVSIEEKPTLDRVVAVIPCLNTGHVIFDVVSGVKKYVDEVIVVDDGSTDNTAEMAKSAGARVIIHGRNMGKGAAMKTATRDIDADIIVFIDGDGQHDPDEIPALLEPVISQKFDAAIGSRHLLGSKISYPLIRRRLSNNLASLAISIITNILLPVIVLLSFRIHLNQLGTKFDSWFFYNSKSKSKKVVTDCTSGFRAVRNKQWRKLNLASQGFQIETEMLYELAKHRVVLTEVPISCKWNGHYSSLSITRDGFKTVRLLARKLASDLKAM